MTQDELPIYIDEAAKILHLSKSRVYVLSSQRKIPLHKRGGRLYYFKSELLDYIKYDAMNKLTDNTDNTQTEIRIETDESPLDAHNQKYNLIMNAMHLLKSNGYRVQKEVKTWEDC